MSRREILLLLLGLVGTGGGAGVQVEATKNYSYVIQDGKPSGVRLDATTYQLGYDLIHTREVYKPRAGAKIEVTGVYITGTDGKPVLVK